MRASSRVSDERERGGREGGREGEREGERARVRSTEFIFFHFSLAT